MLHRISSFLEALEGDKWRFAAIFYENVKNWLSPVKNADLSAFFLVGRAGPGRAGPGREGPKPQKKEVKISG